MKKLLLSTLFLTGATSAYAGDLKVKITDFRNDKGSVTITLYDQKSAFDNIDFQNSKAFIALNVDANDKEFILKELPAGTYAISIHHDENKNMEMDVNNREFPIEGYAFSNNVGSMSVPTFKDASFIHTDDEDSEQTIKMIYIM